MVVTEQDLWDIIDDVGLDVDSIDSIGADGWEIHFATGEVEKATSGIRAVEILRTYASVSR